MAKGTIDDLVKAVDKLESLVKNNERRNNRKRLETVDQQDISKDETPFSFQPIGRQRENKKETPK